MKKLLFILVLSMPIFANAQTDSLSVNSFKNTDEAIAKLVEKAIYAAEKTGEFVIEQAPDLLREFYAWEMSKAIIFITFSIVLMLLGYNCIKFWGRKVEKGYKKDYDEIVFRGYAADETGTIIGMVLSFAFGIVFFVVFSYKLIFMTIAPKLYLIEYFIQ